MLASKVQCCPITINAYFGHCLGLVIYSINHWFSEVRSSNSSEPYIVQVIIESILQHPCSESQERNYI